MGHFSTGCNWLCLTAPCCTRLCLGLPKFTAADWLLLHIYRLTCSKTIIYRLKMLKSYQFGLGRESLNVLFICSPALQQHQHQLNCSSAHILISSYAHVYRCYSNKNSYAHLLSITSASVTFIFFTYIGNNLKI